MKAIQVVVDEALLRKLDTDEEVRRDGRSAVFRRAVAEYLKKRRHAKVAEGYRRAYGSRGSIGREFDGWVDEGVWPDE